MVTMCLRSRRLISSTKAAIVVVLPVPVAPPTSTRPRGSRDSASTPGGRFSPARRGGCGGSTRMAAAARPRSRCRLTRKRPAPALSRASTAAPAWKARAACGGSAPSTVCAISSPSSGASPASGVNRPSTRRARRHPGDEQQVGGAELAHVREPLLETGRRRAGGRRRRWSSNAFSSSTARSRSVMTGSKYLPTASIAQHRAALGARPRHQRGGRWAAKRISAAAAAPCAPWRRR